MESIISAILAGAVTLIGVLIANRRVPILEEQMKVANHRIADLEADEHERERN